MLYYQKTRIFKNEWPFFPFELPKLLNKYERWKKVAKILKLSKTAYLRLWIIYHLQGYSVKATCLHFGISRKTFYKWFKEFSEFNLYSLKKLENKSKAPFRVRQREITPQEEKRIISLRKKHIRYGKIKLAKIYKDTYGKKIFSWKIQKVIEKYKLYYNPKKTAKIAKKRKRAKKKKRITELKSPWYKKRAGFIICLDTITIYWNGLKRYIFTAIDKYGKFAYARMYKSKSSRNSEDFLYRMYYLLDKQIPRVDHDKFEGHFKKTCQKLNIEQYYSRTRTPKDNLDNERFNQTLQNEFLSLGNFHTDPNIFNRNLTEWLIEYNFRRPHQSLNYQTPLEFSKVLPMYSSCTFT